ncbi:hypothetical protein [Streptomyces sp. NPDC058266]|uniref:hypothetical protein n=1 Tax=Streptomyces sp. NPDC058266 TaxID=3346412 RepID=UPI0036E887D1
MKSLATRAALVWAARTPAADRLARGSSRAWQQRVDAITAWVAAGRRDDLAGWRAALGPLFRLAVLGAVAYAVWAIVRAWPWLMWALTGWWLRVAWKAGRDPAETAVDAPAETAVDAPAETAEDEHRATFVRWLDELTRGRNGIHLGELHDRLTQRPALAHLKRADVTPLLRRYAVPVERTLRVDGIAGRSGVSRAAVERLLDELAGPLSPPNSPPASTSAETGSDLRESPDSPAPLRHSPAA